ncbi:MAG: 2Fe-2S iron-sulfur cluster-binding protein, partial [Polyangiaceae bacterium]
MRRIEEPEKPVRMTYDGAEIVGNDGEPIAVSLLGAGHAAVARSPKFHRPRGPACMRAACDGCLARVDGVPNVMTCRTPARNGADILTQNTLGTRDLDLLRVTDWFFPKGMNHHELFAGVVGVERLMQGFARRVAGLGKLPANVEKSKRAERRSADALVIGFGPSGMCAAVALAEKSRAVEIVDDALELGGSIRALAPKSGAWREIEDDFRQMVNAGKIRARARTTAAAIYGDDVLVVGENGLEVIDAKTTVIASGAHDGVLAFEGNDVPGVMSVRAALFALSRGVIVGKKIAIVRSGGDSTFIDAFRAHVSEIEGVSVTVVEGTPVAVGGASRARNVVVRQGKKEKKIS